MSKRSTMIALLALALGGSGALASSPSQADAPDSAASVTQPKGKGEKATDARDARRQDLVPSGGISDKPPALTVSGKSVFVPPNRGTPVARVGGAARSIEHLPQIEALVPLQSGLTLDEQPVLYWYVSEATDLPVNFTLIDLAVEDPLIDVTLPGPFAKGMHAVRLEEHPVHLAQGQLYQWFVALVPDPQDRSSDRLAGGGVELVESKAWLQTRIDNATPEQLPAILAGAGLWYDALAALTDRIDATPADPLPREQRSQLFRQVGLEAVLQN